MSLRRNTRMNSNPKYETIPTSTLDPPPSADDDDDGGESGGIQPFELEKSDSRRIHDDDYRSKRRTCIFTAACIFALMSVIAYDAHLESSISIPAKFHHFGGGGSKSQPKAEEDESKDSSPEESADDAPYDPAPRRVFCYGDSLTYGMAGMHSPHEGPYPYSEYLQRELNYLYDPEYIPKTYNTSSDSVPPTIVDHMGLPGWTAAQMVDHLHDHKNGLCSIIHNIPKLTLLIILVGTNDIAQMTNAGRDVGRSIISKIVDVHKGAFECANDADMGVEVTRHNPRRRDLHTLAVGIPGSAFQQRVPSAYETMSYVNGAMKSFASSYGPSGSGGKVTFVDFPIPYKEGEDKFWSEDGIHLNKEGYEALAKKLAPRVKDILDHIDSKIS